MSSMEAIEANSKECVRLMKSGEYPRELLCNDDPQPLDMNEVVSSFDEVIGQSDRYSFLSRQEYKLEG